MKYNSKVDWWLAIIVWGAMLYAIGSGVFVLMEDTSKTSENIVTSILSIIFPLLILWIWFTTYYVLGEEDLIVRFGPFKKTIPLKSIKSVKKTMNPLSSPALSLKRLEIVYGSNNVVLISPKNREEFIDSLLKRSPNAKLLC